MRARRWILTIVMIAVAAVPIFLFFNMMDETEIESQSIKAYYGEYWETTTINVGNAYTYNTYIIIGDTDEEFYGKIERYDVNKSGNVTSSGILADFSIVLEDGTLRGYSYAGLLTVEGTISNGTVIIELFDESPREYKAK